MNAVDQAATAGDDVDAVAAAVLAVDGVVALYQGLFGEVSSYLPGRRVPGIRLHDQSTEVHVIIRWGAPVPETADAIRRAASAVRSGQIDVTIADVAAAGATELDSHANTGEETS